MTMTVGAADIFADAKTLHADALVMVAQGDIRDAAEKAWCATKRATDALILARTGEEPEKSSATSRQLRELIKQDSQVNVLRGPYYIRMGSLHGDCFYLGLCEPVDDTEQLIRETDQYIQDAERLADSQPTRLSR